MYSYCFFLIFPKATLKSDSHQLELSSFKNVQRNFARVKLRSRFASPPAFLHLFSFTLCLRLNIFVFQTKNSKLSHELCQFSHKKMERTSSGLIRELRDNRAKKRDLISFWILGLCNNYGYVVMLTAAADIIHSDSVNLK